MQKRIPVVISIYGAEYNLHTHNSIYRMYYQCSFIEIRRYLQIWNIKIYVLLFEYCYLNENTPLMLQLNLPVKHTYFEWSQLFYSTSQNNKTSRTTLRSTYSSVLVIGAEVWNSLSVLCTNFHWHWEKRYSVYVMHKSCRTRGHSESADLRQGRSSVSTYFCYTWKFWSLTSEC